MPIVTLTTDFGTRDPYVGAMKGAMLSIVADLQFIDISHDIAPQDVLDGSYVLRHAAGCFPPGTVHLAVVDPGVGSERRALVVDDGRHRWVGPDNGLFTHVLSRPGTRAFEITHPELIQQMVSATFHGRDLFAPAAAHFAAGFEISQAGPRVADAICLPQIVCERTADSLIGHVVHVDHFGNLVTNIGADDLTGVVISGVTAGQARVSGLSSTYADVAPGRPLALIGSGGLLELSIRDGNAAQRYKLGRGAEVSVQLSCESTK
ncbi:MAG: SAM-dependent chlorinase/fluorinase [Gemmatimonadetes bacterium]|nr:SAM-dependent chlorinase/fluorinase [Gemmatimonadota bacterium]MBT7863898.1 SAM-dependent chlorinase/fluorinase [Gemmatimonadota bacterium]